MILSFFKKINLLNWQEIEGDRDDFENPFEYNLIRLYFLQFRIIKFYSIVFLTNGNNYSTYLFFLNIRYNFFSNVTFLLGHFEKNKFQWTNFNYLPYKTFTRLKSVFFTEKIFFKKRLSKFSKLKNIIFLKKKTGFLKKKTKLKNFLLLKLNNLKNHRIFNTLLRKNSTITAPQSFRSKNLNQVDVNKFIDLKKKWHKIFTSNRELLKSFLNIKKTKQFQINKEFYKFVKKNIKTNILKNELTLNNLLIRSKFVFTSHESIFFIKKRFIFINGVCTTNPNHLIKCNDIINLIFFKNYFFFFKTNFNQKLKLTFALGYRLWRLNRFKNNFYKQSPTGIPEWVYKISFFYEDTPSFMEIDYLTLSFSIVKIPTKAYEFNYFFMKFLNFYLLRLYNWKYII